MLLSASSAAGLNLLIILAIALLIAFFTLFVILYSYIFKLVFMAIYKRYKAQKRARYISKGEVRL